MRYPHQEIENKWQGRWEAEGVFRAEDLKPAEKSRKFYGLVEFPYPSGEGLHVGHPRSYVAIDIMTRKKRMEGRDVLYPIGWDAFGLPTENFAIKHKVRPADATAKNVANFKRQLKMLGLGFDWSREVNTTDPGYYKWTQWMFLKFFSSWYDESAGRARPIEDLPIPEDVAAGGETAVREYEDSMRLAFKAKTNINWCPRCRIGLANEEAQGGACERCGEGVEERPKEQWMIRITKYADRLIDDLASVDYLDKIKSQQVNWIGRSEGTYVDFRIVKGSPSITPDGFTQEISNRDPNSLSQVEGLPFLPDKLTVFTTRPDTLFGATYVVMAPEHPLVSVWTKEGSVTNASEVVAYQDKTRALTDLERQENKEKTGVELKGVAAANPATGELVPVWISDYVLAGYGTGAIMAVPAHDERDFEFAKKFGLPIEFVVRPAKAGYLVVEKSLPSGAEAELVRLGEVAVEKTDKNWGKFFRVSVTPEREDALVEYLKTNLIETSDDGGSWYADSMGSTNRVIFRNEGFLVADDQGLEEFKRYGRSVGIPETQLDIKSGAMTEPGFAVNSGFLDGLPTWKAKDDMVSWLAEKGLGSKAVTYKLRDWVFSRQRYWGEPIPIVSCPKCGHVAVPEKDLPVTLPEVAHYEPTDSGESPLAAIRDFVETKCPRCGGAAERETDTMPNWAGSSWYFLRYCDPENDKAFADPEKLKFWMPVDLYNGGMEHTTLHLLYSRFWYKFLWDLGLVPAECGSEPYAKRRSHALIMGEGGIKMSKSKGNVVNPDSVVAEFGADVFRTYMMFIGPFDQDAPWDTNGIVGVRRFLERVYETAMKLTKEDGEDSSEAVRLVHKTVKKVGEDIEVMRFNTAVSALMVCSNGLVEHDVSRETFGTFLKILSPFAPHLAEECWQAIGGKDSLAVGGWPAFDPALAVDSEITLAVQVNGKLRGTVKLSPDATEAEARAAAEASEDIKKHLEGKEVKRVIYVQGRLLSYVVE